METKYTIDIETIYNKIAEKYDSDNDAGNKEWYEVYLDEEIDTIKKHIYDGFTANYEDCLKDMADDRVALQKEIDRLKKENEEFKKQIVELTPAPTPRIEKPKLDIPKKDDALKIRKEWQECARKGIAQTIETNCYVCECGMKLAHKENTYVNRHKNTKKHIERMAELNK